MLVQVITVATPHLGVRASSRYFMGRVRNGLLGTLGNMYGGATLEQMTLTDQAGAGDTALMLHMSCPGELVKAVPLPGMVACIYFSSEHESDAPQ